VRVRFPSGHLELKARPANRWHVVGPRVYIARKTQRLIKTFTTTAAGTTNDSLQFVMGENPINALGCYLSV
jgi:hypothetical protein